MKNRKVVDRIAAIVADHNHVRPEYMFQNSRKQDISDIRSVFQYMCTKYTRETLSDIGMYSKIMGRKRHHDHASVLHSKKKITSLIQFDKKFRINVGEIEEKVLKVVDNEAFKAKKKQKQINEIIDVVFEEEDDRFIELIHDFIGKAYHNRNEENILKCIDFINTIKDEGIHQATQDNTGVGVV